MPTLFEMIFWIVLPILSIGGLIYWLHKDEDKGQASDYWIDRYIHGKK